MWAAQVPRTRICCGGAEALSFSTSNGHNIGALIVTYTILGVPYLFNERKNGPQNPILIIKAAIVPRLRIWTVSEARPRKTTSLFLRSFVRLLRKLLHIMHKRVPA